MDEKDGSGSPVDDFNSREHIGNHFFSNTSPKAKMAGVINMATTETAAGKIGTNRNHEEQESVEKCRQLALMIVCFFTKPDNNNNVRDKYCRTMARTAKELSEKHDILFKSMVNKLNMQKEIKLESFRNTFVAVLDEMFADNKINWGRVVAVYAFGGRLAEFCETRKLNDYQDPLANMLGDYVSKNLGSWIHKNGGWDAFVEYFSTKSALEDRLWKGLLYTAALGIGTMAALVAVR